MMAQMSDASGQFTATCFDDMVAKDLEEAAKAGGCGLLTVELDRRPGEETPRVSIKRIQPFESLAANARFVIEVTVTTPAAFGLLAELLAPHRGARGEIRVKLATALGEATVLLGRDFLLDAELAGHIEALHGVAAVELKTSETRLKLVG
jgi:DNA polymerase-3 subunit alpha